MRKYRFAPDILFARGKRTPVGMPTKAWAYNSPWWGSSMYVKEMTHQKYVGLPLDTKGTLTPDLVYDRDA